MPSLPSPRSALLAAFLLPAFAIGQCNPHWQTGDPQPFTSGSVSSMVSWDPDGAGPLPTQLVVGGASLSAGDLSGANLVVFDGSHWQSLGSLPGTVLRLANWNGTLVALNQVNLAENLYAWNGTTWSSFGSPAGFVYAMATYNGELVVAGSFASINGTNCANIARWNGSTWSPLGSGVTGIVKALAPFGTALYAGGTFTAAGGTAAGNLAVWNGSAWIATPACNGPVEAMTVRNGTALTQQQLFVAGSFTAIGAVAAQHIARFTASTAAWTALGTGLPGTTTVTLFGVNSGLSSFDLVAGVYDPSSSQKMWRWNGTTWVALGTIIDAVATASPSCLSYWSGQYVLGLDQAGQNVRRFDGTQWLPLQGLGVQGRVYAIDGDGTDVVIGGGFAQIGATIVNGIARGTSGNWQPLGSGVDAGGSVFTLARTANGDVLAGGLFPTAGGVAVNNIARWNGSAWSSLGSGLNGTVYAIRVLANGDVVATGSFTTAGLVACNRIARWNGSTWSPLGSGLSAQGNALALAANGDLLVGGNFLTAGGVTCNRIARWNGSTWSALGSGFDSAVFAVAVQTDGTVFAGGHFQNAGAATTRYVASWNGTAWAEPFNLFIRPNDDVLSLTALPDGSVLAGSVFYSIHFGSPPFSISADTCVTQWVPNSGWRTQETSGLAAWATAVTRDGTWYAGGEFQRADGVVSGNVAHRPTPCPATASAYGSGCSGSGGANTLTAVALPWLGGTYRGRASGMPALGFAVVVTGVTPLALPIAALLPQGAPGCSALVSPDVLDLAIPVAGIVSTQLAVPNSAALIGATFRQQVAPFETNALGAVTAITSTNALLLTIGSL